VGRARIAIAGGGPAPVRLAAVERALANAQPSDETFRAALAGASLEIEPDSDIHASADYRRHLTRVLARRALVRAAARAAADKDRLR
jgi:carbon-monoxide dehydrogenase medium subunit